MPATGAIMTELQNDSGNDCISLPGDGPRKGNLQSLLQSYEQNGGGDAASLGAMDDNGPSDLSLQLDGIGRERSSTLGSFRDRGMTFDSEFDLGLGFPDAPPQEVEFGNAGNHHPAERGNFVSANSSNESSAAAHGARVGSSQSQFQLGQSATAGPSVPIMQYIPLNSAQASQPTNVNNIQTRTARSDSFLTGIFGSNSNDKNVNAMFGHTPPSAVATSYEGRHFGKRIRAAVSSVLAKLLCDCIYYCASC